MVSRVNIHHPCVIYYTCTDHSAKQLEWELEAVSYRRSFERIEQCTVSLEIAVNTFVELVFEVFNTILHSVRIIAALSTFFVDAVENNACAMAL